MYVISLCVGCRGEVLLPGLTWPILTEFAHVSTVSWVAWSVFSSGDLALLHESLVPTPPTGYLDLFFWQWHSPREPLFASSLLLYHWPKQVTWPSLAAWQSTTICGYRDMWKVWPLLQSIYTVVLEVKGNQPKWEPDYRHVSHDNPLFLRTPCIISVLTHSHSSSLYQNHSSFTIWLLCRKQPTPKYVPLVF